MKRLNKRTLLYGALLLAVILALAGLTARLAAERRNKTVAFAVDYREISSLGYQNKKPASDVWKELHALGVFGLTAAEYTGDELMLYNAMPIKFGAAGVLSDSAKFSDYANRAAIRYPADMTDAERLYVYLSKKLPACELVRGKKYNTLLLPGTVDEFKYSAFVPDFQALDFCKKYNINVLYRPGPCTPATGENTAKALLYLSKLYPQIKNIIPSGLIAPGYPDLGQIASVLKERGITLSQVEFIKQVGVPQLAQKAGSMVVPMHSLTRDEIISRNVKRSSITDRFIRAVHERSIRLLLVHPYDLQMGGRLEIFKEDLGLYKGELEAHGYKMGWPKPMGSWPAPFAGAMACGLVFIFTLWFFAERMRGAECGAVSPKGALLLFVFAFALGAVMLKVSIAAKLLGGFCGALAATEAALTALGSSRQRFKGAVAGLFIVMAGGLAIASFYGTSAAALRLTPFSGVKLTLLLPPLLVLVHDLVRRVHPESVGEILERPAIWGELVIIGVMLGAMLVMALRSDNVSNVPALEVAFRDFMERVMVVRPRTKEFLIGYPALVLYWYLVRNNFLSGYREAVRIAAVLGFCSAVNTFCHFHTLLYLSVIRVLNGWWLGLVVGVAFTALLSFAVNKILQSKPARL
ncbi:MAG: DUF5693 family protein [Cloacibacillus sp.]